MSWRIGTRTRPVGLEAIVVVVTYRKRGPSLRQRIRRIIELK